MGPTPPGLGETHAAFSQTSLAKSPRILPCADRETPTSTSTAPSLIMSASMSPGRPAAPTTMSACLVCAARSRVPVWHRVTVQFSMRRVSSSPSGRPTVVPRPTTQTSLPGSSMPWRVSSSTMPRGVQGSGPGSLSTRRPSELGARPSASLSGSMSPRAQLVSMCSGSGSWTMYPVQAGFSLSPRISASSRSAVTSAGRSTRIDSIPTWAQSRCLPPTYWCEAGSSPTSTVPRPGTTPFSRSAVTRSASSALIAAAVALPSSF